MVTSFKHLNIPDQWNQYYTKYPEGYTILESLLNWVAQVDSMVDNQNKLNVNVSDFRKELDAFIKRFDPRLQEEVTKILKEWQDSGFLDILIDHALETKFHEMDRRLTSQLADIELNVKHPPAPLVSAKGDGVTDDSGAIKGAIEYLLGKGGGTLKIPAGTYKANFRARHRIHIKGEGIDRTVIEPIDSSKVITTGTDAEPWAYASIQDLSVKGAGLRPEIGIDLYGATNSSFLKNIGVSSCVKNINVNRSWYTNLTNIFSINGDYGLYVNGTSTSNEVNAVNFVNCYFDKNKINGAYLTGQGKGNTFSGCTFENSGQEGLVIEGNIGSTLLNDPYFENNGKEATAPKNIRVKASHEFVGELTIQGGFMFVTGGGGMNIDYQLGSLLSVNAVILYWDGKGTPLKNHIYSNAKFTTVLPCTIINNVTNDIVAEKTFFIPQNRNQADLFRTNNLDLTQKSKYDGSAGGKFLMGHADAVNVDTKQIYRYETTIEGNAQGQKLAVKALRYNDLTQDILTVEPSGAINTHKNPHSNFVIQNANNLPTATETDRGRLLLVKNDTTGDKFYVCIKNQSGNYAWIALS